MKLARNSLYSLLGTAIPVLVALVTVPLYISQIGADRYGAMALAWILLGYFGQADFGIGRAITQRLSSMPDANAAQRADALWSAVFSMLAFGVVGGTLIYFAASYFFAGPFEVEPTLRGELVASAWVLALCNPVVSLFGVASGALMGLERFKLVAIGNVSSTTAVQAFPLIVAFTIGNNMEHLIIAAMLGRVLGLVILGIGVWHALLRGQPIAPSWAEVRRLARFGVWVMVTALVGPLMIYADRFVIGILLSAAAVAAYTIPFQIASRTQMVPIALVQALFPRFAAETDEASRSRCEHYAVFLAQAYAPIVIVLICLSQPLLELWIGSNLDDRSVLIARIILAGFWLNALANVPYAYIQARGNPRFTGLLHLVELPFYCLALYLLGTNFGLAGVAGAFTLRCAIDCTALMRKAELWSMPVMLRLVGHAALIVGAILVCERVESWLVLLALAAAFGGGSIVLGLWQMPDIIRARLLQIPYARLVPLLNRPLT